MGKKIATNKHQKKANRARQKIVKIYTSANKRANKLSNYVKEEENKIHPYKVWQYKDINYRREIIEEAIENNYPEEDLVDVLQYNSTSIRWDMNVSDDILDKFVNLETFNRDARKDKGIVQKFFDKLRYIIRRGGGNS